MPDAARAGAGVLVLHAWWGRNADVLARAGQLRAAGYSVAAPDLFGGRVASTIEEAKALSSSVEKDEAALTRIVDDAVRDLAQKVDRIAIVAWSFGIWYAWKAGTAHHDRVRALVLFYGIGPADPAAPLPPVLSHYAEHDEFEDLDDTRRAERELTAAGRDVRVLVYPGTKHWFDEPSRPEYDERASDLAWQRTMAFLGRHLDR